MLDGDGRERHRQVAEELGGDAAQAHQGNRPEAPIAFHADQQLEAARKRRLRLDGETRWVESGLHLAKRICELPFVSDREADAAGVALVRGAERLEHDRVSDRPRCRDRGFLRFGGSRLGERNPSLGQ